MKLVSFSNIGAIALSGLAFTLASSTLSAHESHGSSKGSHCAPSRGSHCSSRSQGSSRSCSHLPRGCRPSHYRGERCWYGGGNYYRCNSFGTYEVIDQPEVEVQETYEQPVVQRRVVETYVEEPVVEEESEEVVSYLPEDCSTVYVGGERCWFRNGCYYRHSDHGYTKFHCKDQGRGGRTCSNYPKHGSSTCSSYPKRGGSTSSSHPKYGNCWPKSHGTSCSTKNSGNRGGSRVGTHNTSKSSMPHNSGGHGHKK